MIYVNHIPNKGASISSYQDLSRAKSLRTDGDPTSINPSDFSVFLKGFWWVPGWVWGYQVGPSDQKINQLGRALESPIYSEQR